MRIKFVCFLLLVVSSHSFAQMSKEEKLQQLKNRDDLKVTEVEKDLLRIEYPGGKVMYKNVSDYRSPITDNLDYSPTYDSTIIDLTTIDTTLYYDKYSFWQEVPVGNDPNTFLLIGDVSNNKLPELYGRMKDYTTDFTDIVIFEMNQQGTFDSDYSYDSTSIARSIYDIDKDGMEELHLRKFIDDSLYPGNSYLFYRKAAFDSLAKILSFVFYPFEEYTQQNDNFFGDWDKDEFTDQIFVTLNQKINMFEFNSSFFNFDSVYSYDYTSTDFEFGGFAIDDFDYDEKIEFFSGSTHGFVLCIENNDNNSYAPTWLGNVETYNAYQVAQTNDIDRNDKKEIWIGGDAFYPGIGPMTRITIFESDGNDHYLAVGRIDLIGVFSFFAQNYQAVDVDKDGIEEMMVCIEQTVLILKFNGSTNHQTYELFYFKQNDLALAGRNSVYYGAVMYDLINDEREEIIITLDDIVQNVGLKLLTFVYKPEFTIDLNENQFKYPRKFNLYGNYPNPFNSGTKIKFDVPEYSKISVKVYNILGKEISMLLDDELSPGSYTLNWDVMDSNEKLLPSGVYLIRFTADNYTKTIKALLLK